MPERDPLIRKFRYAGALVLLSMGAGFAFGPDAWRSSPSFYVLSSYLHISMRLWGTVFLALGIMQLVALLQYRWGAQRIFAVVAAGVVAAWATSFAMAALLQKLTGISGIPMWGFFAYSQAIQARRLEKRAR